MLEHRAAAQMGEGEGRFDDGKLEIILTAFWHGWNTGGVDAAGRPRLDGTGTLGIAVVLAKEKNGGSACFLRNLHGYKLNARSKGNFRPQRCLDRRGTCRPSCAAPARRPHSPPLNTNQRASSPTSLQRAIGGLPGDPLTLAAPRFPEHEPVRHQQVRSFGASAARNGVSISRSTALWRSFRSTAEGGYAESVG